MGAVVLVADFPLSLSSALELVVFAVVVPSAIPITVVQYVHCGLSVMRPLTEQETESLFEKLTGELYMYFLPLDDSR